MSRVEHDAGNICFIHFGFLQVAVVSASPKPGIDVFQIDIEPEEAQKYLNSPPFTDPQLAGRTAVLPLVMSQFFIFGYNTVMLGFLLRQTIFVTQFS